MIGLGEGKKLITLARDAISSAFSNKDFVVKEELKKEFSKVLGVFVTLNKGGMLRGCIGFPEGVFPLYEGVVKAAKSAAFSDPRFPRLSEEELKDVAIEVSVLTEPKRIRVKRPEEYLKEIKVGRNGLIVRSTFGSGLLLPQVATEYDWDTRTFIEHTCLKAGLPKDSWKDIENCAVFRFQSQVFSENGPRGAVKQII
jgi:uncharacterized protein (TIGR00296 family)